MKWEKVQIGELGTVITGNTPPRKNPELYGDFLPFIKPTDIEIDRRFTHNPEECYSELGFEKYRKSLIPKGATCVVTIGSIGKKITQAYSDCFINQAVNAIIPNKDYDNDFIFYLLKNNLYKVKAIDSGTSSGRENVSKSSFSGIEVNVIKHLPTQRKIAGILSAYDDLIENNLKRIKLLEEAAQVSYKLLVKSEKLEKKVLADFGEIMTGKTPSTANRDFFGDDIPFIKTPDMHHQIFIEHTEQSLSELGAESQMNKFLPPLSLCVSCIGTAGVVGLTSKPSQTNQQINSIVFNDSRNVYYFYILMSQMKEQLEALGSNGSTFTNVNKNKFSNMEVLVPNENTLIDFGSEHETSFKLILTLQKQNTKLREARDILLPRLMNGEIEV